MDPTHGQPPPPSFSPPAAPTTSVPKIFGILSIIFASITLLGGLLQSCSGLASCAMGNMTNMMPRNTPESAALADLMPVLKTVYGAMGVIGVMLVAMSGWLLAIGIGQMRFRRWARASSVYWGAAALVALLGMVLVSALVVGPAYARLFDQMAKAGKGELPAGLSGGMSSLFGGTFSIVMTFFYAPYPILMLVMFTRPRVKQAMTQ